MDEIEWMSAPLTGDVTDTVTVEVREARALVVGRDEVLVIVFPRYVSMHDLMAHRARLQEGLGHRFILLAGDDIQLARVKEGEWGPGGV